MLQARDDFVVALCARVSEIGLSWYTVSTPTETHPARRGRGRPRDPRTDDRIITAAADLMRRRGFERMTVDDVAAQAGVGKATVYRRWPSKDDLAVAAMDRLYSVEIPEVDTGTLRGDLTATYTSVLTFLGTPEGEAYLRMCITESVRDPRIAALYRAATEQAEAQARKMYLRAIDRGEARDDADLDVCVQWLGGLVASRAIMNRPLPTLADVDSLVDLSLRGVLAD